MGRINYALVFIIILLGVVIFTPLSFSETTQEKRVETSKRKSLENTEKTAKVDNFLRPSLDLIDKVYLVMLTGKQVVFRYDLCKILVVLLGVENNYLDLIAQIRFLSDKKIIPANLNGNFDPMQPLRKGLAAYMFSRVLDIKGGVLFTLFNGNERYALKELVFQGIMAAGNTNDIVSGEELVSIVTRAAEYIAKQKKN